MNDPLLARAIAKMLAASPELAGVNVYGHLEKIVDGEPEGSEEIEFPAVLIDAKSTPLTGSASVAMATVNVIVDSQADDDGAAVHNPRQAFVVERMADRNALADALASEGLQLLGPPAPTSSDPDIEARALRGVFAYKIGYAS